MSDIYEGRMIPLKIADMAIINCNKEIEKLQIENDRLKAEVERLTAFTTRTIIPNEELQAQVERLTKAGDQLSADVLFVFGENKDVDDWLAAKEGKGQP